MVATPNLESAATVDGSVRRMFRTTMLIGAPFEARGGRRHSCWSSPLLPGQDRHVDHVIGTLTADSANRAIGLAESERMSGQPVEREALRRQLREGELTRAVAVAPGTADGDGLLREL